MQLYVNHDRDLRAGLGGNGFLVPIGYKEFAANYNAEGLGTSFVYRNEAEELLDANRKSVNPDMLEIDMASCFTLGDFEKCLPEGAHMFLTEQALMYDRMLLLSAQCTLAYEECIAKKELTKCQQSKELEDTEKAIKCLKFKKNSAEASTLESRSKSKGSAAVAAKETNADAIKSKKPKKFHKDKKKLKKDTTDGMDVDE
ncbi:hypothetical protein B0H10DRAFT_1939882 [Mycena sp. CBHHK59/15]|nr:hypothetical protein B0H10DRAFT_1939882 [Mycena sp. CBHHK59/15]